MTPSIKHETEADISAIRRVHEASFPTPAEAGLVDALRASGLLTASLVALVDEQTVGHIAFSPVTIERVAGDAKDAGAGEEALSRGADPPGVGLAPVAVLPDLQRRGVGSELVRAGIDACKAKGFAYAVVLGEPAYYRRFGFQPAHRYGLLNEYGAHDEFMALALRPDGLPVGGGLVRYAPPFGDLT